MAVSIEKLRDRWERMAPRERMLVTALSLTLVVGGLAWVGHSIRDGLAAIEEKNQFSRDALRAMSQYRAGVATRRSEEPTVGDTTVVLDSYLDEIVNEAGLSSPRYPSPEENRRGEYIEVAMNRVKFGGLTIDETTSLLEQIETKKENVVIKDLHIKKHFREKEKLEIELSVATYRKAPAEEEGEED